MTNEEKYKTPRERNEAFIAFCERRQSGTSCKDCGCYEPIDIRCQFLWLTLEAEPEKPEPKPLPCPFCGGEELDCYGSFVQCLTCHADGPLGKDKQDAIVKWNRRGNIQKQD